MKICTQCCQVCSFPVELGYFCTVAALFFALFCSSRVKEIASTHYFKGREPCKNVIGLDLGYSSWAGFVSHTWQPFSASTLGFGLLCAIQSIMHKLSFLSSSGLYYFIPFFECLVFDISFINIFKKKSHITTQHPNITKQNNRHILNISKSSQKGGREEGQ